MEGFYEVRITAKRYIDKERDLDFMSFTGFNKKGKKFTMKFTQDCENIPEKEGEYMLFIPKGKINQDKIYLNIKEKKKRYRHIKKSML